MRICDLSKQGRAASRVNRPERATLAQPRILFWLATFFVLLPEYGPAATSAAEWETVKATGAPTARHEAALVAYDGKIYLIGGRRINPVDVFDPLTGSWTAKSKTPIELHHFQAVVLGETMYLMGAMTGAYPRETPLERVAIYRPADNQFEFTDVIPAARRRGGAGAAVYRDKIYLIGGITNGHIDGYQPWFDEYDPVTGQWRQLPDAPHARDHFQAVVNGDRLYALAGRTTSKATNQVFDLTVTEIDVYDFKEGRWLPSDECPSLPTPRAGNMALAWRDEVIVGGGESMSQRPAHDQVEAFNVKTRNWQLWPSLGRGRHGSGFAVVGGYVYTASGSGNRGGGPELTSIERLKLP